MISPLCRRAPAALILAKERFWRVLVVHTRWGPSARFLTLARHRCHAPHVVVKLFELLLWTELDKSRVFIHPVPLPEGQLP